MRAKGLIAWTLAAVFAGPSLAALAAGPFDGVWQGRAITEYGRCPHRYAVQLTIRDGVVRGNMVSNYERMTVDTVVDGGGRLAEVFAYNGRTQLKATSGGLGERAGRVGWTSQEPDFFEDSDVGTCHGVIKLERTGE